MFTELSVGDFMGMDFKPKMSMRDYFIAVYEVEKLKSMYEEEDNLVAEQDEEFCIKKQERITQNIRSLLSSFPPLKKKKKNVDDLAFNVPTKKRTERPRKEVTEQFFHKDELIKKAVENSEEKRQEENRAKVSTENRVSKINWVVIGKPHGKEELNDPLGFTNEEFYRITSFVKSSSAKPKREREDKQVVTREKKKVKRNIVNNDQLLPRELPVEFKNVITNAIGGSLESATLVIEKRLYGSDVKREEGRLSIPRKQVWNEFLKPEEDEHLNTRNGGSMSEIRAKFIEPSLKISEINLRKWNMEKTNGKTSSSYVLVTFWNDVTQRNSLKTDDLVQLWAFRKDSELCFALVKVKEALGKSN